MLKKSWLLLVFIFMLAPQCHVLGMATITYDEQNLNPTIKDLITLEHISTERIQNQILDYKNKLNSLKTKLYILYTSGCVIGAGTLFFLIKHIFFNENDSNDFDKNNDKVKEPKIDKQYNQTFETYWHNKMEKIKQLSTFGGNISYGIQKGLTFAFYFFVSSLILKTLSSISTVFQKQLSNTFGLFSSKKIIEQDIHEFLYGYQIIKTTLLSYESSCRFFLNNSLAQNNSNNKPYLKIISIFKQQLINQHQNVIKTFEKMLSFLLAIKQTGSTENLNMISILEEREAATISIEADIYTDTLQDVINLNIDQEILDKIKNANEFLEYFFLHINEIVRRCLGY